MMIPTRLLRIAIPAVIGVGLVTAVVLGGGHSRRAVTIPAGTVLVAALNDEVSTAGSDVGDDITLRTVAPIRLRDAIIPEGAVIRGEVAKAKGGGRIAGAPELVLQFSELEVSGERQAIAAEPFRVTGKSEAGKSAVEIGGGAVAGGILGRVLGGRSGTLKGAVVGAAIGTGVALHSEGGQLVLPAGQQLRIRLTGPVTVSYLPARSATAR